MRRTSVIRNSVSTTLVYAVSVVTSFVLAPVIVRSFGTEAYGLWELIVGLVGYLSLLDLGISPAVVRYVALARGAGDTRHLRAVFSAGAAFCLSLGGVGAVVLALSSIAPQWLFGAGVATHVEIHTVLLLFSLNFIANYAAAVPICYLLGSQQYTTVNAFRVCATLLQTAIAYYLLSDEPSSPMTVLVSVTLAFTTAELLFFTWLVRIQPDAPSLTRQVPLSLVGELFRFGAKSAALTAAFTLLRNGLLFVLAHVAGVGVVIFFVFPLRLVEMAQSLGVVIGLPLTPYFAEALGRRGGAPATEDWLTSTRALQFVTFGVALGVAWLGLPFLGRWIGTEYVDRGATAFWILCVGLVAQCLATNCGRMLMSSGRHGPLAISALIFGSTSLILAIALVARFGVTGAAVAHATFVVCQSTTEVWLVCRHLKIDPIRHLALAIARYGPSLLAGSVAFLLCRRVSYPGAYADIAAHGLIGSATYGVVCLATALSVKERRVAWLAVKTRVGFP